jgi:hypothetical protein
MIRNRRLGDCVATAYVNTPGQPGYFSNIPTGQTIPATCQEQMCSPGATVTPLMLSANHDPNFLATILATGYVSDGQGGYVCQDPRVPPGSYLAPGTWNGDCNNPVVADAQGNMAYVAACYPNTPLGVSLASQQAGGGPVSLNPTSAAATTPAPAAAAPSSVLSSLSGLPWYYYAGGAAALLFLFGGGGKR